MKSTLVALFVVAMSCVVVGADQPSVARKWLVHSTVSGTEYDSTCTFNQKDTAVTGACENDAGYAWYAGI